MSLVRKAVIPAAGYGTRFLPISKAIPKEMLPLVDKPVIQYVVEEAVASGITDILMVISRSKRAIEEHFHPAFDLEAELEAKGRKEDLEDLRRLQSLAKIHFIWQPKMGGLGDAILYARDHVGNEPFAVLLGDTVVTTKDESRPLTRQLADVVEQRGGSAVALQEVSLEKVSRYGILGGEELEPGLIRARQFVEKPKPEEAPSRLAVSARYVLSPRIFDHLEKTPKGKGGELQLTDAMASLMQEEALYGLHYEGQRHDIGNKLDFIKANLHFGLQHADIGEALREYVKSLS
ncbi:UTP--glucose-1-phosphate uridylyltransferase GalU [Prosthecobacter dejongeii]|uniref:UTP--glucose-1-phosphate uridylyltransferase n=1 Tax=Prosthecobacter dejongeii TaxID=48465 RepID=A0A7W7YL45_9BACT|nr:UTP--glucose-1-phosphate uridylyltransferase GalU [Prosthecobacter dejongeii]MBB5038206.1 UTP--glucose-1-phosphate uridylyltransferase [Prosthecobacter dejongeii]